MIEFNEQLTRHLRIIGRRIETTHVNNYYSNDSGTVTIFPLDGSEGVEVEYEKGRDADSKEVRFLNSTFRIDKRTGKYRIDRAAGLLLAEEARVLAQRVKQKEQDKITEAWRKRRRWASSLNENLLNTNLSVTIPYDHDETYYTVEFKTEDQATVMAVVDFLRESRFVEEKIPEKKEE